jgi:hypothetical protein
MVDSAERSRALDAWRKAVCEDEAIKAGWIESATQEGLTEASDSLSLHVSLADPDYDAFLERRIAFLEAASPVVSSRDEDHPWEGIHTLAELENGMNVDFWIERITLISKKPRAFVRPLEDKTHHLRFSMDYSLREARCVGGSWF